MSEIVETDICIIGGGSGGLVVAAGASQMGARTVLIERAAMGGECLNEGCVPSKALIAAGRAASEARLASRFGVETKTCVDFGRVNEHVKGVIASIAPNDSVARFEGLGVNFVKASAKFVSPSEVDVGGKRIKSRRFVVATGSSPFVPKIPGLDDVPYMTNQTVFDNQTLPDHLVVIGGGSIGLELALAYRNLGAKVTVVERLAIMGTVDPELARIVENCMRCLGVDILKNTKVLSVCNTSSGIGIELERNGRGQRLEATHLLIATGRQANIEGLGLEAAGVDIGNDGIVVDRRLRTSNKKIFAIGDVTGGMQFTHVASYEAGIVIRNALFRLPAKVDYSSMPWVTYTDPELAQVGLTEEKARSVYGKIRILRWPFAENDRASTERRGDGLVKVLTTKRGRIVGAGIVGFNAGDLIQPWTLAIQNRLRIGAMAGLNVPYPTRGEASRRAGGNFFTSALFSKRIRRIVRFLAHLG